MAETPNIEPSEITKGDTITFLKSFPDYPASQGWSLAYTFAGPSKQTVSSSADGDSFLVSTSSSSWTAGDYWYQGVVSKGSEKYTVSTGALTVRPALSDVTGTYDGRSHVKKVLDALEAAIEGRASRTDKEYELDMGGSRRRIQHMTHAELIQAHARYKDLYRQELQTELLNKGLGTGRKIRTRFI